MTTTRFKRRISREKANELVAGVLTRAKEINANSELLVSIRAIHAFGSYITDKQDLGDVDLLLDLQLRDRGDIPKQTLARMKKLGRVRYWNCEYTFGYDEVKVLLKDRQWPLSLHTMIDDYIPRKEIFRAESNGENNDRPRSTRPT